MKKLNVAIVGIGAVGRTMLKVLENRKFPIKNLKILAKDKSVGQEIEFKEKKYIIEKITLNSFNGFDIAFFAGGNASKFFAEDISKRGVIVIDNSSFFRLKKEIPLIVPEVNPDDIKNHNGIISNPNCSTIQMCVALKPINDFSKIKKIIVSTYQAVSGAGKEGIEELIKQTKLILENKKIIANKFQHQIAFNLIPHIDVFLDNFYSKEEMKLKLETQKIFNNYKIKISATAVRVPIIRCHSESICIETENKITREIALNLFKNAKGIILQDNLNKNIYPMPYLSTGKDDVYVGRVREDIVFKNGLNFFVVADQLRKGAATNAIQIGELLLEKNII